MHYLGEAHEMNFPFVYLDLFKTQKKKRYRALTVRVGALPHPTLSSTLAGICHFAIPQLGEGGGGTSIPRGHIYCNRSSQQRGTEYVACSNLTMPDLTSLGHVLTFPRQVKQEMLLLVH